MIGQGGDMNFVSWDGFHRRAITVLLAAAVALPLALGALAADEGEPKTAAPPGFDYWQPEWMVRELWGPGHMPKGMMVRLLRHTTYVQTGVPKEYEGAQSTVAPGPETTSAGAKLYAGNCASCHGANGMGNGEAGRALSPSPALLAYMIRRPISVDEYLLWTVSEGGKAFGTEMPAFKDKLTRDEIWRVIAYMRAGFPAVTAP
jgi:mono/diheme cytochrome c family protein